MLARKVYNNKIIFWSKIFSYLFFPYFKIINYFRPIYDLNRIDIDTILVTEYHRIGDVLIIEPVLRSIKTRFPNAHLILICNNNVGELARHINLADEIVTTNVPWTNWSWSILEWWRARSFAKSFSSKQIDLAFDFKGDYRNGWFLWLMHPKVSFGYDTTGGDYFFTNPIKMNQNSHQLYRAADMVSNVGCELIERKKIPYVAKENGSIVVHVGATDLRRSWPIQNWVTLVELLSNKIKISIVKTNESKQLIKQLKKTNSKVEYFKGNLVEFKNWLVQQKCIICPDSMAGHMAAYVGIPVISLFGSQIPELTYPISENKIVITPDIPCNHKSSHWRLCSQCMASIRPKKVYIAIVNSIINQ